MFFLFFQLQQQQQLNNQRRQFSIQVERRNLLYSKMLKIGTSKIITVIVQTFKYFFHAEKRLTDVDKIPNGEDPDQTGPLGAV